MDSINTNLDKVIAALKLNLFPRKFMDSLGMKMIDIIYKRTKTGYGVDGERKIKLDKLSDLYIEYRKGKIKIFTNKKTGKIFIVHAGADNSDFQKNRYTKLRRNIIRFLLNKKAKRKKTGVDYFFTSPVTGEFGSPERSNLTLTGQMLKAIDYRFKMADNSGEGFVEVYVQSTGRDGGGPNNEQVANWVSEKRPFMGLHEGERRVLINFIKRHIIETITTMIRSK